MISGATDLLNGNYAPIVMELEDKMREASENLDYEKAASFRDLIESVKLCGQKQKIESGIDDNRDIIAMAKNDSSSVVQVLVTGRAPYLVTIFWPSTE